MSSVSKEYGREYYTAATYSYRVPHRGINEKLAYLICQKTGKWNSNGVIPSREFQALMTELIEEAYDTHQSPLGI
tara:strand:- start:1409 stop:1633 length:225 start_codon:yes stop_codon:yes gene_type:complete